MTGPEGGSAAAAGTGTRARMGLVEAMEVVRDCRTDEVVVTTMGAAREWMRLSQHPLDFTYVPGAMGHATSLGLGIALARPDRRTIVCNGDGSLLMNLGTLVTIGAARPRNLVVLLFDNGVYEVTGAQATPATQVARGEGRRDVDLAEMARLSGFAEVATYDDLDAWKRDAPARLAAPGPVFVRLLVAPVPGARGPKSPGPGLARSLAFAAALREST